jgi:hypothetical protein
MIACNKGDVSIINYLIENGTIINTQNNNGDYPQKNNHSKERY